MKKKNRIKKLVVLASALATMGFGSSLYAATFTAQADGDWNSPATWGGSVPTAADDVEINAYAITISGNGLTYAVKSLNLTDATSVLQPAVGEEVTLAVGGNITFGHADAKIQQNGTGKLNMNITSSAILDLKAATNLEVNDLTLTNGSVAADDACAITIKGDLNITGTSSLEMKEASPAVAGINFSTGNHTVTVDPTAQLSVAKLTNELGSELTTSSDITITAVLSNAGTFTANGGKVVFNDAAAVCWANTGVLILNDVEFLGTKAYAPATGALVKGNFSNLTTDPGTVTPTGKIEFTGASQKEILNIGTVANLDFDGGIVVAPGASVVTSSSFTIGGNLEVQSGASFKADAGGITFGDANSDISAATPNSIEFNDLLIGAAVTTSSDFKILGNLTTTAAGLTASGGTITFENVAEKTITLHAADEITFANLKVAAGSKVITAATDATGSFTVKDGGIEVEGTGSLKVAAAATTTFTGDNTIKKSDAGTLEFGLIDNKYIPAVTVSPVKPAVPATLTTASDFTVTGATFTNTGTFTATDGTITFTFTGATPAIVAAADETKTVFNSITTDGATTLTVTTARAISINGDLTVNGTSTFAGADAAAIVHFTGSKDQKITGSSNATIPVSFPKVTVNKSGGKLLLEKNVTGVASGTLALTKGIVDLGETTFTANVAPTSTNGAIDGNKGTYVVETAQTLKDDFFTVDGEPTLNNLTAIDVLTLGGDLTVNGNLDLQVDANVIDGNTLTVKGNLTRKTGSTPAGNFTNATGKLVLTGNGKTAGLSNDYFDTSCGVNLEVGRAETLGGNLTMAAAKTLYVNTGINYLDLGTNTLTTTVSTNTSLLGIERISGAIKADEGKVVLGPTDPFTLPGNLFKDNTVKTLTIAGVMTLGSDLTVNGVLTNAKNIITGDNNIMTLGPQSPFTTAANTGYIVGNLKRTVKNTATIFEIGGGTGEADYNPVTLNFQTPGTTQEVIVSAKATEPTVGRAGNPENALDLVYTIKPVGTDPNDALNATFETGTAAGTTGNAKRNIAAKWENDAWKDYRNGKSNANDAIIDDYSIANSTALAGDWAVFSISQDYDNTDEANTAVDAAISTAAKNVVITNISPNPVQLNRPFTVTVQLQDQFGQPITTETPVNVKLTKKLGATTITDEPVKGVITAGSSFTTLTATASTAAGANIQLQADDDDVANVYTPTVSKAFNVVDDAPATQATIGTITPANTTADIAWTSTATALIVLKAGEPLTKAEYPVNGTTYTADALYGAGSQIGDAVVVAKGATAASPATVRSLSPNTTYYAYAFAFAGSNGTESYKLSAASGNPQAFTTSGSNDDDVAFGENNTRETSRTIGTNTPVKGTIKDATDEDWFNFSVSSANPNVRAQLSNLPAGYNVEIYNTEGKRIRRGIRLGQGSEGPVINGLAAGTYTLKIYSSDGSSSAEPYTLKVGTKSSEIFSVTP